MPAPNHTAVQRAVFEALIAHAPLVSMLPNGAQGIAAFVHPDNSLPYVAIEGIASQPVQTQTDALDDCEVICAAYSDQPGGAQTRSILQEIATALSAPLSVTGYRVVLQRGRSLQAQLTSNGSIYRGTYSFQIILEKDEV